MIRGIRKHLRDLVALVVLAAIGVAVAGYILSEQRMRFPLVEEEPFRLKAELADAQAVTPGQGQTVRVAGVSIGQIGEVELEEGRAVVELVLEPEYEGFVRDDATALLRAKTGLKDMFLEVDPGEGEHLEEGGRIRVENTAPDIDPDEILAALDADTRDYLKLLITGAGKGLRGRGSDLRETLARLGPLHRDLAHVSSAVARRRENLRQLIHNYGLLVSELGRKERELTELVRSSNAVFGSFAAEDENVSGLVAKLPATLRQTESTLRKVDELGSALAPALNALRAPLRKLDEANEAVIPLAREGAPLIRDQLRPFARKASPFLATLGAGSRRLAAAGPDLTKSFHQLNRFFNIGAYNPGGREELTGELAADRARNEGYLYWLAWVAQNTTNLFNVHDAHGPLRRLTLGGLNCSLFPSIAADAGLPTEQIELAVTLFGGIGACSR